MLKEQGLLWVLQKTNTVTPFGEQRKRLRRFYSPEEKAELLSELKAVDYFLQLLRHEEALISSVGYQFCRVKDIRRSIEGVQDGHVLDEIELFELKQFADLESKILEKVRGLSGFPSDIVLPDLSEIARLLNPQRSKLLSFAIYSEYDPGLKLLREEKSLLEKKLREQEPSEDLLALRRELIERIRDKEAEVRKRLSQSVSERAGDILTSMEAIGVLDHRIAKARLASNYQAVLPEILAETGFQAEKLRHPYYEEIFSEKGHAMQPLSLTLKNGTTVLSGANMGGKSVTLSTITLNLRLLQMGYFPFAEHFESSLFESIELIREDEADLRKGLSSFGAEIIRFRRVLEDSRRKVSFFAFDEPARGTNPEEGRAILRVLARAFEESGSVVLLATHLPDILSQDMRHLQMRGLRADELESMSHWNEEEAIASIEEVMDYTIDEVDFDTPIPRQAVLLMEKMGFEPGVTKAIREELGEKHGKTRP